MREYGQKECKNALNRLRVYMELLNEQMAYTKEEIARYKRNYRKVVGEQESLELINEVDQTIIYYTKEELQNE